jgi:hypothetical protein
MTPQAKLKICVFSKHLQWASVKDAADLAKEIGFDGIDLTVRAGGHIEPERVEAELPAAVDAIRSAGLEVPMITTDILPSTMEKADAVLRTAGKLGIRHYRWGELMYDANRSIPDQLVTLGPKMKALAQLNERRCQHHHRPMLLGFVANYCSTPALSTMDIHVEDTYIQEYNLAVQHQFGSKSSLAVAYGGNRTSHMEQPWSINDPNPGPGTIQTRRPLPQWGTISNARLAGDANYNALQSKLETPALAGATVLVSYTYGKCLTDGTYNSVTRELNPAIRDYGPCSYDIRHNFVTSALYESPFGKGKAIFSDLPHFANGAVSNWSLSGIAALQSGLTFTPTISSDQANTGVGSQRPKVIGTPVLVRKANCWFYDSADSSCGSGTNAFAVPALYTYGNGGINTLRADGLVQFDVSLIRSIHFNKTRALELRGSFFNVFNHTTFAAPGSNIDSSSAGVVTSTLNASREIELAAKIYF